MNWGTTQIGFILFFKQNQAGTFDYAYNARLEIKIISYRLEQGELTFNFYK